MFLVCCCYWFCFYCSCCCCRQKLYSSTHHWKCLFACTITLILVQFPVCRSFLDDLTKTPLDDEIFTLTNIQCTSFVQLHPTTHTHTVVKKENFYSHLISPWFIRCAFLPFLFFFSISSHILPPYCLRLRAHLKCLTQQYIHKINWLLLFWLHFVSHLSFRFMHASSSALFISSLHLFYVLLLLLPPLLLFIMCVCVLLLTDDAKTTRKNIPISI